MAGGLASIPLPRPSPTLNFALAAALAAFALAALSPALFNDGDTYWHIRAGEWILDHRAVPHQDIFSYTRAGAPWSPAEWLAQVMMALAFRAGGWTGLHLLFGVAAGLAAGIVAGALRARLALTAALLVTVLGLACVSGSLLARPHLLALPLLALWTAELVRAREADRAPGWWLLAAMPLWANLHGGFAFGLALAAALAVEAIIDGKGCGPMPWRWGAFVLAAAMSALLTPQGLDGLLFPLRLLGMSSLHHLGEWLPSDLSTITPFGIALLALVGVLVTGKVRVPWPRAIILLGLVYLALAHQRHQLLFGVAGPLLLAPSLAVSWPRGAEPASPLIAPLSAIALCGVALLRLSLPVARGDDAMSPVTALAHVPVRLHALPVLNDYGFGGYLIWRGVKPFIDSRADLYGDGFLADYAVLTAPDRNRLAAALAERKVRWTILAAGAPVTKAMDTMPGWHRLYGDAIAVVHVRN